MATTETPTMPLAGHAPFDWGVSGEGCEFDPNWRQEDGAHYGRAALLPHPTTLGNARAVIVRVTVYTDR